MSYNVNCLHSSLRGGNLKKKRAQAAVKLDNLENSSADAWDSTKDGFADAYKDLHDAYKEAVGKFK